LSVVPPKARAYVKPLDPAAIPSIVAVVDNLLQILPKHVLLSVQVVGESSKTPQAESVQSCGQV
jgi:NADPH-dependent ferric siderophore reductase